MIDDLEQQLGQLRRSIPEPSAQSTNTSRTAVLSRYAPQPRTIRPVRLVAIAGVTLTAAIVSAVLLFQQGSSGTSATGPATTQRVVRAVGPGFSVASPFTHGRRVTLDVARSDFGSAIALPDVPNLADSQLIGNVFEASDVYDNGGRSTSIAVTYPATRVVVIYQTPPSYKHPEKIYRAYVNQTPQNLPGLASVGTIGDHPALLIEQGKDATGTNPGSVEFVANHVKIAVIGYRPTSDLLPIAESIIGGTAQ